MAFAIPQQRLGMLMVVSGPSGTGKTTLCRKLCEEGEAVFSVSCTRLPPNERPVITEVPSSSVEATRTIPDGMVR